MITVKQLLQGKGSEVWSISPEDLVIDAMQMLADKNIGALIVIKLGKPVGIVSERDIVRKVDLGGKTSANMRVREIMTRDVLCAGPDHTIEQCMALMTNRRIRHLPVIENGDVTGVISIGDVVKAVISDQEFMIEQLEKYIITGST